MERVGMEAFTYLGHVELTEEQRKKGREQALRAAAIARRQMETGRIL